MIRDSSTTEATRQWLRAWARDGDDTSSDAALIASAERGLTWDGELTLEVSQSRRLRDASRLLLGVSAVPAAEEEK